MSSTFSTDSPGSPGGNGVARVLPTDAGLQTVDLEEIKPKTAVLRFRGARYTVGY